VLEHVLIHPIAGLQRYCNPDFRFLTWTTAAGRPIEMDQIKLMMFCAAVRQVVLRGATQRADAVRVTLGPKAGKERERGEAACL